MYNTGRCGEGKSNSHSQNFSHKPCLLSGMFCISTSRDAVRAVAVAKRREYNTSAFDTYILRIWYLLGCQSRAGFVFATANI